MSQIKFKIEQGFKIEKGIPTPSSRRTGLTEALRAMKVGDSLLIPADLRTTISGYQARLKMRFTVRSQEGGLLRVWRIE